MIIKILQKSKHPFNRERLLLTLLVALAFFGFLLWFIEEFNQEEAAVLASNQSNQALVENKIIKIISPKANGIIKSPVLISGQALTVKGSFQINLKDASGLLLAQKQITVKENSPFSSSLTYKKPTRIKGTIEIFIIPQKNVPGTKILTIPVIFKD